MFTPIQLDKMRNFRYGMVAIHKIESVLKTKMGKLDMNDLSQYELAVIIWAGLVHEDQTLTPDSVMELIDQHSTIVEVAEVMSEAFSHAFGGSESDGKKARKTTK